MDRVLFAPCGGTRCDVINIIALAGQSSAKTEAKMHSRQTFSLTFSSQAFPHLDDSRFHIGCEFFISLL